MINNIGFGVDNLRYAVDNRFIELRSATLPPKMSYDNRHNITAGQVYVSRETGEEVTVTKYTRIDATRGDVRVKGYAFGIELRTFWNEYRLK